MIGNGEGTRPSTSRGITSVFCTARRAASSQAALPLDFTRRGVPTMVPSGEVWIWISAAWPR